MSERNANLEGVVLPDGQPLAHAYPPEREGETSEDVWPLIEKEVG